MKSDRKARVVVNWMNFSILGINSIEEPYTKKPGNNKLPGFLNHRGVNYLNTTEFLDTESSNNTHTNEF